MLQLYQGAHTIILLINNLAWRYRFLYSEYSRIFFLKKHSFKTRVSVAVDFLQYLCIYFNKPYLPSKFQRTNVPRQREDLSENTLLRVCVCVCVCARARVCVCVFTSIRREGFICLDQLGYQGTDQRCYVEDVYFLCPVPSSLISNAEPNLSNQSLYPVRTLEVEKATT